MALIHIGGKTYEIWHENRNGWNAEAFRDRYSEVLERYDFIVGDWGYNQLRLKGFFKDNHQKASKESSFSCMSDYINEYCNFGCAYFVLEKTQSSKKEPEDYDLDSDDFRPRLEAADLLAAAEGNYPEMSESDETAEHEVATAREPVPVLPHPRHHRNHRSDQRHGGGSNRQNNDSRGVESAIDAEGRTNNEPRSGKREFQSRKNYRGNDHRGKKPFRLAANETAAASADSNRPNKKDAERS
ncbi:YutD family protein [Paenibacillus harenae]|uniref:YutD family protein n=1 Tax=Paenibacillus harenae TaxID=306543 RepID=UPI000404A75F|nr:YutD family protein [Paenibacillus harenae]